MSVQSFITIKWQEKKLSMIKILKLFVSDHLKLIHFSGKSGRLSSTGSEILAFGSHFSANFQSILDCFLPKFKLKYDDLETIKGGRVNTVVFNFTSNQTVKVCFETPGITTSTVSEFKIDFDKTK